MPESSEKAKSQRKIKKEIRQAKKELTHAKKDINKAKKILKISDVAETTEFKNTYQKPLVEKWFKKKNKKDRKVSMHYAQYAIVYSFYIFFGDVIPYGLLFLYTYHIAGSILFYDSAGVMIAHNNPSYEFTHFKELFQEFAYIIQDPINAVIVFTFPLVLIGIYLLRQMTNAIVGRLIYRLYNWIRPKREFLKAKFTGPLADDINMYRSRNVLLRVLKWQYTKGPFPWLAPWMFNYVGTNNVGDNVVVEECLHCPEYVDLHDNTYWGFMVGASSHAIEGNYNAFTLRRMRIDENGVVGNYTLLTPGFHLGANSQITPHSAPMKFWKTKPGTDNLGFPIARLSRSKYWNYIQLPEDKQELDKKIRKERKKALKEEKI